MYVRLGLAVVNLTTFLKNPRFNANWQMKQPNQLKAWYTLLMNHLRTSQYGVYFAVHEIFGVHAAEFIAVKASLKKPESLIPNPQQRVVRQANVVDNDNE